MALIGLARVSKDEQVTDTQLDELRAFGCQRIFEERESALARHRPVLAEALAAVGRGDTFVIVRIDRLARSLKHLIEVIEHLQAIGAHFKSLNDPIDTASPQGEFTLQILGAVAQLEAKLTSQRTKASLKAARERGRVGGNPLLRRKDPAAIKRLSRSRSRAHFFDITASAEEWLPAVRRLRPARPWHQVARAVNAQLPQARHWTAERLKRATRKMVMEGLADPRLMEPAPRRCDTRLMTLVAGIARANPALTLAGIGQQLTAMREKTPRNAVQWYPSSVKSLLDRARRDGLLG